MRAYKGLLSYLFEYQARVRFYTQPTKLRCDPSLSPHLLELVCVQECTLDFPRIAPSPSHGSIGVRFPMLVLLLLDLPEAQTRALYLASSGPWLTLFRKADCA
jgi:hypothetical protein